MPDEELMLAHCEGDADAFPVLRERYSHVPSEVMDTIENDPPWYWQSLFGKVTFADHVAITENPPEDIDSRTILDFIEVLAADRVKLFTRLQALTA